MNCQLAAELLPLHAGDDLVNARRRAALAAHLSDCDACRRLADEWAESRSLLRLHAPPEFDAAFFDGIRRAVMQEISAPRTPSGLAKLCALVLRPRTLAYAAALLPIVAAATLVALLFFQTKPALQLAAGGSSMTAIIGAARPVIDKNVELPPLKGAAANNRANSTLRAKRDARRDVVSPQLASRAQSPGNTGAAIGASSAAASRAFTRATSPDAPLSDRAAATLPDERKLLRIEWQTRDPNVRIIWLTPQTNERSSLPVSNDYR
jgi:hypothetical protein